MKINKLITVLFIIILSNQIYALEDPSSTSFKVSKSSTNLYTGDLSETIPLFTVPGIKGLNYPLTVSYSSGVKVDQEASFLGLGWNLNLASITRSVKGIPDDSENGFLFDNSATGQDAFSQDSYFLSSSTTAGKFYFYKPLNSQEHETALPVLINNKPVKLEYTLIPSDGITKWTLTDIDGTKYIFANRVKIQNTINTRKFYYKEYVDTLTPYISPEGNNVNEACGYPMSSLSKSENCWPFYYDSEDYTLLSQFDNSVSSTSSETQPQYTYSWHLTSILSNDYVDNGNGIVDNNDQGSWIKLEYITPELINFDGEEKISNIPSNQLTLSRMPGSNCQSHSDPECSEWLSHDFERSSNLANVWIYTQIDSSVEYSYIDKIITPINEAKFIYSLRDDLKDINNQKKTKKLDRVELKNTQETEIYKKAIFDYD